MNGNKMAVVILNNHCHICQFFNPEGKSRKYFQVGKQLYFLTDNLTFPGKSFNKVPDSLLGPRMLLLQHRCHCWCHSFAFTFQFSS